MLYALSRIHTLSMVSRVHPQLIHTFSEVSIWHSFSRIHIHSQRSVKYNTQKDVQTLSVLYNLLFIPIRSQRTVYSINSDLDISGLSQRALRE